MGRHLSVIILSIFLLAGAVRGWSSPIQESSSDVLQSNAKFAVIDSGAFPEGIGEYKKELNRLEAEFQPRLKELEALQNNLVKLDDELKAKKPILDQQTFRQKDEALYRVKKELERKREDYQYDLEKRSEDLLGPVHDKILNSMKEFAASRNITAILDATAMVQNGLLYFNPAINITNDFIKEYNRKNPAQNLLQQPEKQHK